MKILISNRKKIITIQKEFSEMFPYLKLEFAGRKMRQRVVREKRASKQPSETLHELRSRHQADVIAITPQTTVTDLEKNFGDTYGVSVHVLRKSGKAWLETSVTASWTLQMQNNQGEALSAHLNTKRNP